MLQQQCEYENQKFTFLIKNIHLYVFARLPAVGFSELGHIERGKFIYIAAIPTTNSKEKEFWRIFKSFCRVLSWNDMCPMTKSELPELVNVYRLVNINCMIHLRQIIFLEDFAWEIEDKFSNDSHVRKLYQAYQNCVERLPLHN